MHKKQFSRVFVGDSAYVLLLYLLYSSEEDINKTFFFFGPEINKSISNIRNKFANNYYLFPLLKKISKTRIRTLYRYFMRLFIWVMRQNQWSFLKKADFFGQDHLPVFNYIIGNNIYTLFEDAPYCFKFALPRLRKPSRNILSRLLSGKHKQRLFGNNDKCNEIIITENEIQPYMKDKKINTVFLSSLWENSSMLKRQLIMDIFDVTPQDIELIKSKENILLTQCFVEDNIITPEERCRIYRKIVDNYDRSTLLIKKHPREIFDYKTLFPDILVFEKTTPMHLLTLLGIRFKKAITVFSSSVASFDYDIEIDWYGTEISKVLVDGFGVIKCPPLYTTKESNSTIVK